MALVGFSFSPSAVATRADGETEPTSSEPIQTSEEIPSEPEMASSEPVSEPIEESSPELSSEPAEPSSEASEPSSETVENPAKVRYSVFYLNSANEEVADKSDVILGEKTYQHGDVQFFADSWEVGDEIRFSIKRNASYKAEGTRLYIGSYAISSVSVSFADATSQTLLPADGIYSFTAREEQDLRVVFSNDIESFTSMDLSETNWKSFFSTQNLVTIVMFLLTIFIAGGASVVITKLSKRLAKKETSDQEAATAMVTSSLDPVITEAFQKYVAPSIDKMGVQTDKNTEMLKAVSKCLILMQSDKPEDKIALAETMESLDKDNSDVAEQVKKAMQEVIDGAQRKKAEQEAAIKKVEETTASMAKKDDPGNYGQI